MPSAFPLALAPCLRKRSSPRRAVKADGRTLAALQVHKLYRVTDVTPRPNVICLWLKPPQKKDVGTEMERASYPLSGADLCRPGCRASSTGRGSQHQLHRLIATPRRELQARSPDDELRGLMRSPPLLRVPQFWPLDAPIPRALCCGQLPSKTPFSKHFPLIQQPDAFYRTSSANQTQCPSGLEKEARPTSRFYRSFWDMRQLAKRRRRRESHVSTP